jgi:hypothetical protein
MIGKFIAAASAVAAAVYFQKRPQRFLLSDREAQRRVALMRKYGGSESFSGLGTIPPPPSDDMDLLYWYKKTYGGAERGGTRVKMAMGGRAKPGNENISPGHAGTTADVRGPITSKMDGHQYMSIDVATVLHRPLFLSTEENHVWVPFRCSFSKTGAEECLKMLVPLDDNWGALVPTVKHAAPIPQRGWARQAAASRSMRARRP